MSQRLSSNSTERKGAPVAEGFLDYFPNAIVEVAKLSKAGNDKHNPGQPLHWSFDKSSDHADCITRHLLDRDKVDEEDGIPHVIKIAWRAMALAEAYLIERGATPGKNVRRDPVVQPAGVEWSWKEDDPLDVLDRRPERQEALRQMMNSITAENMPSLIVQAHQPKGPRDFSNILPLENLLLADDSV